MKTLEERRLEFENMFVSPIYGTEDRSNGWDDEEYGFDVGVTPRKLWQWFKLQMEEEHREQVLHKSYNKKNTLRLAKFMHEEYENMARLQGWETQEKCRVSFEALPEKNIKTMLGVAQQILKNFLPTLKNSKEVK